jgi:hypothetical protein
MIGERTKVRILLGTDILGRPTVLAADYWGVQIDVAAVSAHAEDLGICDERKCPRPGLYVFEGTVGIEDIGGAHTTEMGVTYKGTMRPVHPREIDELFAMNSSEPEPEENGDDQGPKG